MCDSFDRPRQRTFWSRSMSKSARQATKIMVIRHAEKPAPDFAPYGFNFEGDRDKECLTARGWQRAGGLANLFAPTDGHFQNALLAKPKFLYASKPLKRKGSKRPV